jgi:hypothetical protein
MKKEDAIQILIRAGYEIRKDPIGKRIGRFSSFIGLLSW